MCLGHIEVRRIPSKKRAMSELDGGPSPKHHTPAKPKPKVCIQIYALPLLNVFYQSNEIQGNTNFWNSYL